MTETVTTAVAKQDTGVETLIRHYADRFGDVLPEHIVTDQFVGLAIGALNRDPKLRKAAETNRGSFLNALLDCARLGHTPGTDEYALVPFGSEVVGIEQYQGQIERMYRAGAVASIVAELVYDKDDFTFRLGVDDKPTHEVDWFNPDRGTMVGAYAYATMRGGATSKVIVMGRADIEKHRDASPAAKAKDSPWTKWPEAMWLKTVVRQLEKWVPKSAEYRREQLRAALEVQRSRRDYADTEAGTVDTDTGEIHDAELVDEEGKTA